MGPVRDFGPYRAILQERCTSLLFDSSVTESEAIHNVGSSIQAAATSSVVTATATTVSDEEPSTNKSWAALSHSPPPPSGDIHAGDSREKQRPGMVSPAHTPIGMIRIKRYAYLGLFLLRMCAILMLYLSF